MREIEKEVKSKGKTVGKVKVTIASNLQEAIKLAGGEDKAVELINAKLIIDAMNKARRPAGGKSVKAIVGKIMSDPNTPQEDKNKILEILKKYNIEM